MHEPRVLPPLSRLETKRADLIARFLEGKEPDFFESHAETLDDYFRDAFATSSVGPGLRMEKNPCAIVALGGYGRKEQCIHSDVDVLLLFKKRIPEGATDLVHEIFYPMWDAGLDVSYATRSIKECTTIGTQDFEVLTSLIDGRFVCGISSLYSDLMERLRDKVLRKQGRNYVNWLSERNRERHCRFGDSTYLLEPNLKEGQGGLRDFHAMLWAARAAYEIAEPRDLEFLGHLTHDEFRTLSQALAFVRKVRNWLHHITGRKCDQLYFEYQVALSKALGFKNGNRRKGVEEFLGVLHSQMEFLKRQHLIFLSRALRARKRPTKEPFHRKLSAGIELVDDTLHFESPEAIVHNPRLLVKIFEKSADIEKPLSVAASRLVREFLYLVDDKFRKADPVIKSLKRIVSAPLQGFNVLDEMLNTGMLVSLIPEVKDIVNLIQYDEYHLYPVDKHSLQTVQVLKRFRDGDPEDEKAFYAGIFREIKNQEVLLWAGLFHDIGKGNGDEDHRHHAAEGAETVERIFRRMGFPDEEIETIAFLVREHLFLIHTATRRDINDEKIVVHCARRFRDEERLRMLYLLTVADSMATGPKAWNDWKDALLRELFFKIYHILKEGDLGSSAAEDMVRQKKEKVIAHAASIPKDELEALFDELAPRYVLYTPAEEIVSHLALHQSLGAQPSVLTATAVPGTNFRTITVCARDFPGLFSKIAGLFTLHDLNILSAQIYTWRNHIALDIFKVEAPLDRLNEDQKWKRVNEDLRAALGGELSLGAALKEKLAAGRVRMKTAWKPDRIVVDNETSDFFSLIEVYTHDRPGLLYRITDALFRCGLDISVARIGTKVDQVVDVFYVRDFEGQKADTPERVSSIKQAIQEALAADGAARQDGHLLG